MVYWPRRRVSRLLRVSGDRTQAVRRSSVACPGDTSASDWDDSSHSSPHSVLPSIGSVQGTRSGALGKSGRPAKRRGLAGRKVASLATDQTLRCRECGREFVFTAGEQEFYLSRGLMNTPSRCPECRAARKASMSGGGGGYSGERPARQMYTATCSECGGEARVPFVPRGDKPVYCSDCFQQHQGSGGGGGGGRRNYGSSW